MKKILSIIIFIIALLLINSIFGSVPDADKDGVPDDSDKCPDSKVIAVDTSGCSCEQKTSNCVGNWCCESDNKVCTKDCEVDKESGKPVCRNVPDDDAKCEGGVCKGGNCVTPRFTLKSGDSGKYKTHRGEGKIECDKGFKLVSASGGCDGRCRNWRWERTSNGCKTHEGRRNRGTPWCKIECAKEDSEKVENAKKEREKDLEKWEGNICKSCGGGEEKKCYKEECKSLGNCYYQGGGKCRSRCKLCGGFFFSCTEERCKSQGENCVFKSEKGKTGDCNPS